MDQHEQIGKTVILHPGPRGRVITKLEVNGDQTHSSVEILDPSWDRKNMTETSKKIDTLLRENKSIVEKGFTQEVAICLEPISALDKKERNSDLGKLICEMLCSIEKKAHFAFINSGSIRIGELEKGPLTLKDLTNMFTGGDGAVWTVSANGAWVEKIMAAVESRWNGESKHIQYGGIVKGTDGELFIQGEPLEKERFYDVRAPKFFFQREELPESIINNEYLEHPETLTQLISAAFCEQKVIKKS